MPNKTIESKKSRRKMRIRSRTLKKSFKKPLPNETKSRIVQTFLEMLNTVKLYHWKTHSYAQHKATDELYSKLNENIDTFVEILLGKDESRIKMVEKRSRLIDSENTKDFKSRIYEYREFLIDISKYFNEKRDTDLLNVRDEILGHINQFLYLMTFNK
jgi:DNA-binding ferritin-like protein